MPRKGLYPKSLYRKPAGNYAVYTDAGLIAYNVSLSHARQIAAKIKHGKATITTASGQPVKNPQRIKGSKVAGGRAVTLHNFTGRVTRKRNGEVLIIGRSR